MRELGREGERERGRQVRTERAGGREGVGGRREGGRERERARGSQEGVEEREGGGGRE